MKFIEDRELSPIEINALDWLIDGVLENQVSEGLLAEAVKVFEELEF